MEEKLHKFILDNGLILAGDHILIGVSGGADSLALLHFLAKHRLTYKVKLGVAHLNHDMRGLVAVSDENFVKNECQKLNIPFYSKTTNVIQLSQNEKISIEEAGRKARYALFNRIMVEENYNKLALAHHLNDQAETVLMRLIRGTGVAGICGMRIQTEKIIRPLLAVTKEEILNYCTRENLNFIEDSTNFEVDTTRNFLRLKVFPLLNEINPRVSDHFVEFASIASEYDAIINALAKSYMDANFSNSGGYGQLKLDDFLSKPSLVQKEIIRGCIKIIKDNLKDISYNHISAVLSALEKSTSNFDLDLPGGMCIGRRYNTLCFWLKSEENEVGFGSYLIIPGKSYYLAKDRFFISTKLMDNNLLKKVETSQNNNEKYFDYGKMKGKLSIRARKVGDFYYPIGMLGKKTIKNFMIDRKIHRNHRNNIPLLLIEDEVLWIIGHAISRHYQVDDTTEKILVVKTEFL